MTLVVTDTSAWYALLNPHDAHHPAARQFLERYTGRLLTTSYVVAETANLIHTRLGAQRAITWLTLLHQSQLVDIVYLNPAQHEQITELFTQYAPKGLSFTDCSSLFVLQEQQLAQAFCFDRDFLDAGVTCVP
jgi:predicted nucleic acid-binding protein